MSESEELELALEGLSQASFSFKTKLRIYRIDLVSLLKRVARGDPHIYGIWQVFSKRF